MLHVIHVLSAPLATEIVSPRDSSTLICETDPRTEVEGLLVAVEALRLVGGLLATALTALVDWLMMLAFRCVPL